MPSGAQPAGRSIRSGPGGAAAAGSAPAGQQRGYRDAIAVYEHLFADQAQKKEERKRAKAEGLDPYADELPSSDVSPVADGSE